MRVKLSSEIFHVRRAAFLLACALTLAGIVHLAAVLLIPYTSIAASHLAGIVAEPMHTTSLIETQKTSDQAPRFLDPSTAIAACAYDLSRHPLRVTVPTGDEILTLSFHGTDGRVFYALSDRAAQKNVIELVLMTRRQLDDALSLDEEDDVAKDVRLLSPVTTGLAVVRVLGLQPGDMKEARARALQMRCTPEPAPVN